MVARDFDQYLLNAFTGIIGKKIDRERVKRITSLVSFLSSSHKTKEYLTGCQFDETVSFLLFLWKIV